MPRIFVCFGGEWKENEKEYVGGHMKGLIVDIEITYEHFLQEIYRISGTNSVEYELVIRCMYNVRPKVSAFVISNQEDLNFFLTGEDVSKIALLVSKVPMVVHKSRSTTTSPVPMAQSVHSFRSHLDFTPEYNVSSNDLQSLSPLNDNVVPIGLRDDTNGMLNRESLFDVDMSINCDVNISVEDVDIFEANNEVVHPDTLNDQHPINIDVNCMQNVESQTDKELLGESNSTTNSAQSTNSITSCELGATCRKRKRISKLKTIPVVLSSDSVVEDVQVGNLFTSKKDLCKILSVIAIVKNFQFRVERSTKKLYIVKCIESACKWRVRAIKRKDSDMFKITKYVTGHTCQKILRKKDHKQARSWVIAELMKTKYQNVGRGYKPKEIIQDFRKEYGVDISYERAWRARECALASTSGCHVLEKP